MSTEELLERISNQIFKQAEAWNRTTNDPYNIAQAVQVALAEVAHSINITLLSKDDPNP